jgi:ABC-type sugar transport system ATPase subunit
MVGGTQMRLPFPARYHTRVADGDTMTIGVRPEHLRLTGPDVEPGVPCTVEMTEILVSDAAQLVHLRHGEHSFCARLDLQRSVRPRELLWLHFPPEHLAYFASDGQRL